jgi:hypothetical protein
VRRVQLFAGSAILGTRLRIRSAARALLGSQPQQPQDAANNFSDESEQSFDKEG